jgi:two-component system NtrC family sensor kinase
LKGLEDEKYAKYAQNLNAEAQRAIGIVQDLLSFARKQKPEKILVSINESLESVIRLRSHDMSLDNIKVETELAPNLPKVMGDFQQLQQVFLNLILNAEQAIKEFRNNGNIVIQTKMVDQKIEIEISDNGPGIPQEFQGKIFEPFFTTKEVGKGTGLGLSICYGIIQEHEGIILVESNVGEGVTFTVELPIVAEAILSIS